MERNDVSEICDLEVESLSNSNAMSPISTLVCALIKCFCLKMGC